MLIDLIRHGLSKQNTGQQDVRTVGDSRIELSPTGHKQGRALGRKFGKDQVRRTLWYCSPFLRTRQTWQAILAGANLDASAVTVCEDPRLREVDHGYDEVEKQERLRVIHGWFYYRFTGGESPADCYDRICTFVESLHRQIKRKRPERVGIVCHGLTMRVFVMRWLHLTAEQFDLMANPRNCDVVTIGTLDELEREFGTVPQFKCGRWGVVGLRFRDDISRS